MSYQYILVRRQPVAVTFEEWLVWMQEYEKTGKDWRRVAIHEHNGVMVSTVFLSLDHGFNDTGPPALFETMVFVDGEDRGCERYCTWDEAIMGHLAMCVRVFKPGWESEYAPDEDSTSDESNDPS